MTEPTTRVVPEADATPLVRLLTRTIRTSLAQQPDVLLAASRPSLLVVQSATDAQAASVELLDDEIRVVNGAREAADATLTVDLARRLEIFAAEGPRDVVDLAEVLIRPTLPSWSEAAHDFWRVTGQDVGMPRTLVVQNADLDDDVLALGAGLPRYVVHGTSDALAGLFTGADSFLDAVFAGNLLVQGTLPQLSVMAGASFKVRFHV
ncbi:hypothetical protein GCM10027062_14840 [Nocardioides hungaricus]